MVYLPLSFQNLQRSYILHQIVRFPEIKRKIFNDLKKFDEFANSFFIIHYDIYNFELLQQASKYFGGGTKITTYYY